MRKIYYTLLSLGIVAMVFSSCSDWLDVRPSDEIKEEFLFETGNGYRTALNGIYRKLSTQDLYGQNLSWGIVDALGEVYDYDIVSDVGGGKAMKKVSRKPCPCLAGLGVITDRSAGETTLSGERIFCVADCGAGT